MFFFPSLWFSILGLILLFSVPMAYARYKPTIDAMVCSKLELVRSITVRQYVLSDLLFVR